MRSVEGAARTRSTVWWRGSAPAQSFECATKSRNNDVFDMVYASIRLEANLDAHTCSLQFRLGLPEAQAVVFWVARAFMVVNRRSARLQEAEAASQSQGNKRRLPEPASEADDTIMAESSPPEASAVTDKERAAAQAARQRLYGSTSPLVRCLFESEALCPIAARNRAFQLSSKAAR